MFDFWWRPLISVAVLTLLSLFVWVWQGAIPALFLFAGGLLTYLVHHLRQLSRLNQWLNNPLQSIPASDGIWGDVLYRLQKLMRGHQLAQERSQADLEQTLQAMRLFPDGVIILDAQHRIDWLNEAAQQHLGLHPDRDTGQFITYLLRNTQFSSWLAEAPDNSLTLTSPVTAARTLSMKLVPLPRGQKMLLSHDITELLRVDAMRRDFVANVSHELRTPVTVIVGFLEAFADMARPDPDQMKKHIGLMIEQSDRIRRLVDDLLTLARLEADTEIKDESIDIQTLARGLLNEARTLSNGHHEVLLELESSSRLRGSPSEIHSALGNLVSNAVRYTPEGGRITLRWSQTSAGCGEFSVSDTGEGIEAQHIPRLTERFYRVDRGRSRATGGTGLGLAIVKHVLQRHQGRLKVESTVGRGSTFTAAFPAERITQGAGMTTAGSAPLPAEA